MTKTCYILAGPNGAGKTTFAEHYLPKVVGCVHFINADMIAKGLSPFRPEMASVEAGKLLFHKMEAFSREGISFAFETTLSGKAHIARIHNLKVLGYRIVIYYLKLSSPDLAVERVACRVREGGHVIPEETIRRRFTRSWENFEKNYRELADEWIVFDSDERNPKIIEKGGNHE